MRLEGRPPRLVLAAFLVLPACAARHYDVSAIGAVPKTAGRSDGYAARLDLSGLEVRIQALDEAAPASAGADPAAPEAAAPPLSLRLRIGSKELGYSFDPGRVVLRSAGAEWPARRSYSAGCDVSGVLAESTGGRLWLARRACLVLAFDASVGGGEGQQLVLDGFARGRRALAPVVMAVARRPATAHELTPAGKGVLMAPLYILTLLGAAAGAVP